MDSLSDMSILPSTPFYLSILQECTRSKSYARSKQVFELLRRHGVKVNGLLGDYLVLALARSGELEDAREISETLPHMSLYAWSALISGYVACGNGEEAMDIYHKMQQDDVEPSNFTLIALLKACGMNQDVERGKMFYAFSCMNGFMAHDDVFLGCAIVSMYGRCGFVLDAECVFCGMWERDIVLWNAMMSAYLENGHIQEVLQLYKQIMSYDHAINPNEVTFLIAIQACGDLMNGEDCVGTELEARNVGLEIGKTLHACVYKRGFRSSVSIRNTLISMYGKLGAVTEAEALFAESSHRDVVSWNALFSAYVTNQEGNKALKLYAAVKQEGLSLDSLTLAMALKACELLYFKEKGDLPNKYSIDMICMQIIRALHTDVCLMGFCSDLIVAVTLIGVYNSCGAIMESERVFFSLPQRDSIAWNKMLSAYIMHGHEDKALLLYRQMQEEEAITDAHTLVYALQAYGNLVEKQDAAAAGDDDDGETTYSDQHKEPRIGTALHAYVKQRGLMLTNIFVVNTIIGMYGKCGAIAEAEMVFSALAQPDVISYNAMLSSYANTGQGEMALCLFWQMQENGIDPIELTFVIALQACVILALKQDLQRKTRNDVVALEIGKALHKDAERKGFMSNTAVGSSTMNMYAKCGDMTEMENLFSILSSNPSIVPWNTILSSYVRDGRPEEALTLLRKAQEQHADFDVLTLNAILQACSSTGKLEICREVHFSITSSCCEEFPLLATTLVFAYGSCGGSIEMQALFDGLPFVMDPVLWNAFLGGSVGGGGGGSVVGESLHMFERFRIAGMEPDEVAFTSILSICSHEGLITIAAVVFESMGRNCAIVPNSKHYGAMVGLFGRAGDFQRLENMLEKMQVIEETDLVTWLSLLGACCTHGNTSFAEWAFQHSVMVNPRRVSAYVLMSNAYAYAAGSSRCHCLAP